MFRDTSVSGTHRLGAGHVPGGGQGGHPDVNRQGLGGGAAGEGRDDLSLTQVTQGLEGHQHLLVVAVTVGAQQRGEQAHHILDVHVVGTLRVGLEAEGAGQGGDGQHHVGLGLRGLEEGLQDREG